MNLLEKIDEKLKKSGLDIISNVVDNKNKCFTYINNLLAKAGNNVAIPEQIAIKKYDFRIKHVLLSFGLGFLFADFNNIEEKINTQYHFQNITNKFAYIWLTLCLYHDYGYFITSPYADIDDFKNIALGHSIFDYNYSKSRYTRALYVKYYNEKYQYQLKKKKSQSWEGEEVGDHGILGGYILFDKLYENSTSFEINEQQIKIPFYQDICYRIMEHNIWRKNENFDEGDAFYAIGNDNFRVIDASELLLYILSLVDTVEMTKRFRKNSEVKSSREVLPSNISSQFDIDVSDTKIVINYSRLGDYLRRNKYNKADIDSWVNNIVELEKWVNVNVYNDNNLNRISICKK